jgi:hypothetical protein
MVDLNGYKTEDEAKKFKISFQKMKESVRRFFNWLLTSKLYFKYETRQSNAWGLECLGLINEDYISEQKMLAFLSDKTNIRSSYLKFLDLPTFVKEKAFTNSYDAYGDLIWGNKFYIDYCLGKFDELASVENEFCLNIKKTFSSFEIDHNFLGFEKMFWFVCSCSSSSIKEAKLDTIPNVSLNDQISTYVSIKDCIDWTKQKYLRNGINLVSIAFLSDGDRDIIESQQKKSITNTHPGIYGLAEQLDMLFSTLNDYDSSGYYKFFAQSVKQIKYEQPKTVVVPISKNKTKEVELVKAPTSNVVNPNSVIQNSNISISLLKDNKLSTVQTPQKLTAGNNSFVSRVNTGNSNVIVNNEINSIFSEIGKVNLREKIRNVFKYFIDNNLCFMYTSSAYGNDNFFQGITNNTSVNEDINLLQIVRSDKKNCIVVMSYNEMIERRVKNYKGVENKYDRIWGTPFYIKKIFNRFDEWANVSDTTILYGLNVPLTIDYFHVERNIKSIQIFYWQMLACSSGNVSLKKYTNNYYISIPSTFDSVSTKNCIKYAEMQMNKDGIEISWTNELDELEKKLLNPSYIIVKENMDRIVSYSEMLDFADLLQNEIDLEQKKLASESFVKKSIMETAQDNDTDNSDKKHQFWIGNAPFCGAKDEECSTFGFYKAVPESEITEEDRKTYGASCWSGKKVLCRWDKESAKNDVTANLLDKWNGDPDRYEIKWFGTGPFCNGTVNDCLKEGFLPIKSSTFGDGANCATGSKMMGMKPKFVSDEYTKLFKSLQSTLLQLSVQEGITDEKLKQTIMDSVQLGIKAVGKLL